MARGHGYSGYTNGCRCEVCREAKAAYIRGKRRRAALRRVLAERWGLFYVAQGIAHGIAGYQDHQCRCEVCRLAKAEATERETRRQKVMV